VAGAVFTIASKNPIRGAMGLLLTILCIAGLFLSLHAEFLAVIQLIVYAGAIVVLFLFVIMLLGPSAVGPRDQRGIFARGIGGLVFAGCAAGAMYLIIRGGKLAYIRDLEDPHSTANAVADFGSVNAFGRLLFSEDLVPFELSAAILMVAVLGAVAVAKGKLTGGGGAPAQGEGTTERNS
jgi:NADH-quinone oxidoreductase subunit J